MTIELGPELAAALIERSKQEGVSPEQLAIQALEVRFLPPKPLPEISHEEWVRRLRSIATNCGVSLSDWAVSRDAMYD